MNKLSLIIPVYNGAKYLPCFLRICDAAFQNNVQKIFVDDGSTDASLAILEAYKKTHTNTVVFSQTNAGPGVARNTGFKAVTGEYTWFIDSDDSIVPDAFSSFKSICEYLKDDFDIVLLNKNSNANTEHQPDAPPAVSITIKEALLFSNVAPWTRIYKTVFLKKNNFSFPPFYFGEDLAETTRLMTCARKVYKTSLTLYKYENNPQSISRTKLDKYSDDFIQAIQLLKKLADDKKEFRDELLFLMHSHLNFVICHLAEMHSNENIIRNLTNIYRDLNIESNIYYRIEQQTALRYTSTRSWKLTAGLRKLTAWIRLCTIK